MGIKMSIESNKDPLEFMIDVSIDKISRDGKDEYTKEDMVSFLQDVVCEVRKSHRGRTYIRGHNENKEKVYILWNGRYKTDSTLSMNEVYLEISDIIGNIKPSTVRKIITEIRKEDNA